MVLFAVIHQYIYLLIQCLKYTALVRSKFNSSYLLLAIINIILLNFKKLLYFSLHFRLY